ncbi:MAG: protein translocase subunit SecF [Bacteroidota bacterium]|nr:protein translocase subunit SecF [Bacteroidota bacterium]MDP4232178.1 protein translocase subunit SecF [Bacteroidota bacterium]MDP4241114.1 protein translocase subunit SecF [Bacteroidota bacterium]MDP4286506.1 protein translocase subunit SecF [Bacteroidota bacterium]
MRFFRKTSIDFIGKRRTWYVVSILITVTGIVWALFRGVEYGIDFAGGTEVQLQFQKDVSIEQMRGALDAAGIRGAEVKYYGRDASGVLVRVREGAQGAQAGAEATKKVLGAVAQGFPTNKSILLQEQHIGPKIGAELRAKAVWAVFFTCVVILIYLAFRFRFVYGLGAVIAIIHDVLVAFAFAVICNGIWPWLNLEMNSTLLAAFLTIVGFSVNDTVIIFDRIREDQKKYKGQSLKEIMNRAINETLPRTIITSGTVFLTLLVLFIWGGEVLRGFAFTMLIGVITGTYSSIFVASAIAYDWLERGKSKTTPVAANVRSRRSAGQMATSV